GCKRKKQRQRKKNENAKTAFSHLAAGTGVVRRIFAIMDFGSVCCLRRPCKISRWHKTGKAIRCTSSGITNERPSSIAQPFDASISEIEPRGLIPIFTPCIVLVDLVMLIIYLKTSSEHLIFSLSCCILTTSSAKATGDSVFAALPIRC